MSRRWLLAAFVACCLLLAAGPAVGQSAPGAPTITSATAAANSLSLSWTAPSDNGGTAITGYDLHYIETSASDKDVDANWTQVTGIWSVGTLSYTLFGLYDGTGYDVQLRAANPTPGDWSASFSQTTLDHGGQTSTATALTLGSSLPGDLSSASDDDYFRITVTEFTYLWTHTTGDADTVGVLYRSDNTVVRSDDDGLFLEGPFNFSIRAQLDTGTYYLKVSQKDGSPTGRYQFHAQAVTDPGNSLSTATPVTLNSITPGRVGNGSEGTQDVFKLVLDRQTDVWFMIYGETQTNTELWNSSGKTIDNSQGQYTSWRFDAQGRWGSILGFEHFPLPAGTYYVRVQRWFDFNVVTWPEGPYLFFVGTIGDPASSAESAAALSHLEPQSGRLETTADADYFSVTLTEETYLAIEVLAFTFPHTGRRPLKVTVLDGGREVDLFDITLTRSLYAGWPTTEVNAWL